MAEFRLNFTAEDINERLQRIDELDLIKRSIPVLIYDEIPDPSSENLMKSKDIHKALGDREKLEFDVPKIGSNSLVTSNDIYQAIQDSIKVASVNGKGGNVTLNYEDVGAMPSTQFIPSKVTDLTDKDNYFTKDEVNSALATKMPSTQFIPSKVTDLTDKNNYYTKNEVDASLNKKQTIQMISNKGNTGSETWYYPLGTMVVDNSGNYGNYTFTGRLGGWTNGNSATYSIMLMNRGSYDGNSITSTVSAAGLYDSAISIVDIVVSKNSDLSHTVYLACTGYFLFDFAWTAFQHEINYTGNYTTTAPSNIIWRLSTAPKTILDSSGKFSASGGMVIAAGDISSGTLSSSRLPTVPVSKGGTGYTSITDTTYTTARYRASALSATDATPTTNGTIIWFYE